MAFDFHPILEAGDSPRPSQWYVVSPEGSNSCPAPCQRVGACANFVADEIEGGGGRVLISAGAAPEGLCSDIYELLITEGADQPFKLIGASPTYSAVHCTVLVSRASPSCSYIKEGLVNEPTSACPQV